MKVCPKCKRYLDLTEFYKNKACKDGLSFYCKDCHKQFVANTHNPIKRKEYRRNAKVRLKLELDNYKASKGCKDCGNTNPIVLDFDHLEGNTKEFTICWAKQRISKERLFSEIAKCEVVCSNCHRIRTYNRTVLNKQIKGT